MSKVFHWVTHWLGVMPFLSVLVGFPALAQSGGQTPSGLCPAQLGSAIEAVIDRPALARSRWGVLIQTLDATPLRRQTLYQRDARRYFTPASTAKLVTTAAALTQLGPQFRIRTAIYQQLRPDSKQTVLQIVGRGDPSLSQAQLRDLARQLRQRGIGQITQLLAEATYFQGSGIHPTWEWEDVQAGYGAPVTSLIVNQNALDFTLFPQMVGQPLRVQWDDPATAIGWQIENQTTTVAATAPEFIEVGREFSRPILRVRGQLRAGAAPEPTSVSVPDPGQFFLQQFRRALVAEQVQVLQLRLTTHAKPPDAMELAAVQSPPLSELIRETNQESNNVYAEALLRTLGQMAQNLPAITESSGAGITVDRGLVAVRKGLSALGVDPTGYVQADGSGLSRRNLVSPEALVQILQAMAPLPTAAVYRASLPVAGVSGTLQSRFRGTAAQGIVQAKTGTLTGVSALAGYVEPPNYPPLAFSILVNQSEANTTTLRGAIDEVVLLMTRLRPCP